MTRKILFRAIFASAEKDLALDIALKIIGIILKQQSEMPPESSDCAATLEAKTTAMIAYPLVMLSGTLLYVCSSNDTVETRKKLWIVEFPEIAQKYHPR